MEKSDPAAVRLQRSAFLSSLSRPVSPPPGAVTNGHQQRSSPVVIDSDSDADSASPKKKPRLQPPQSSSDPLSTAREDACAQDARARIYPSPFQLTKIQDLPDSHNIDTVSLHDILGSNSIHHLSRTASFCFLWSTPLPLLTTVMALLLSWLA